MTYKQIQEDAIRAYRITIKDHSTCRARMHAHIRSRTICKWTHKNSIQATFDLFHEIGHIETTKSSMRRCEAEYYATMWAIDRFKEYGLEVPEKTIKEYQDYIYTELDRGIRRHGSDMPSRADLELKVG